MNQTNMHRHRRSLFLLLFFPFLLQHTAAQKVSFGFQSLAAGSEIRLISGMRSEMTLTISVDGAEQTVPMSAAINEIKRERVVAPGETSWSTAVVTYESYDEVESRPNASPKENKPAPVIGRSYRIERGDSLRVRAEDPGKGISEGERSFLAAAYGRMDGRMRFGAVLRGRSLAVGDSLLLDREAAGPIFTDMKGANDVRSFKLYFQEIRRDRGGDCALFRAAILLGGNSGPLEMSMELTGTILVGISDGRLYALELAGPVQARSVNSDLPITGRGMISTRRSVQYNAH